MARRFKVPLALTVVAVSALGCHATAPEPDHARQCPSTYFCTTDAAQAENCGPDFGNFAVLTSDLGSCYPPI